MGDVLWHFGLAELLGKVLPFIFHVRFNFFYFFSHGLPKQTGPDFLIEYRGLAAWLKLWSRKLFHSEPIKDFAVWWCLGSSKCCIAYSSVTRQEQAWSLCIPHPSIHTGAPS